MCLAIPGQVIELVDGTNGQLALVDVLGTRRHINVGLLEDDESAVPGDWILIHMGFALSVVDEAEAARALGGLEMLGNTASRDSDPQDSDPQDSDPRDSDPRDSELAKAAVPAAIP